MYPQTSAQGTQFRLWGPHADEVTLRIYTDHSSSYHTMQREETGHHTIQLKGYGHGTRYHYLVNNQALPDPASPFQPEGVHGASQVVDFTQFNWSADRKWQGIPLRDLVFYELHIGTFTRDGTYLSTIERLDELVELGINALQIMPLAQCPGRWNWGYDGVQLFAPNHNYGSPEELCELIKSCHCRGLAIYLDVVDNHLGPEGNYLKQFAPYFHQKATIWGECPDMCNSDVRAFFIENARYWVEQYHFDGIRFDAIAMIHDPSPVHIMNEIGALYRELSKKQGRHIHAIGESNIYQPEFLPEHGGAMHALWSDDIGHAAEATVTHIHAHGTRDYNGTSDLMTALQQGCLFRRSFKGHAEHRPKNSSRVIIERCINQLQNHDIVGNSPSGKRIHQYTTLETQCAIAALILLYPTIPMLFMGEEFSANSPFLFFTDFTSSELRNAVEQGRESEFPHHSWEEAISPASPDAFQHSKLPPRDTGSFSTHAWYSALIRLRKKWLNTGLLSESNLTVIGTPDDALYILKYTHRRQPHFVAVKLKHGASSATVYQVQKIQLQSGNATLENGQLTLHPNSCVVGEGAIQLSKS